MNKCTNCGHEFEGNFCPNCGAKYEGEHIGAMEADVSQPVQPVQPAQPASQHTQAPKIVKKLYAHMPKLISVLFAVFAVLMLICFAGGVQKSDLGEEFGGTPESVYSYISSSDASAEEELEEEFSAFAAADDEDIFGEDSDATLKNVCAALVAFGVIAVVFAAFGLAVAFWVPLSAVKFHIGDRTLKLSHIVNIISYTLVFVIFLLGCILCANAGDELGLAEPGAAPICIIFFSLLFGLLMVAALFGRKIISYIWGGVKQEYEDELKERRVGLVAPVAPDVVAKPQKPKKPEKPCKYDLPAEVIDSVSEDDKKKIAKHVRSREIVVYLVLFPYLAVIGSVIAIIYFVGTKAKDFWKVCKRDSILTANFFAPFTVVGIIITIVCLALLSGIGNPIVVSTRSEFNKYIKYTWYHNYYEDEYDYGASGSMDRSALSMWDRKNYSNGEDLSDFFNSTTAIKQYHLSYDEKKAILELLTNESETSVEKFGNYILQRQNLCDFVANFSSDRYVKEIDCLRFFFAEADGLEAAIEGYDQNVQPILKALDKYYSYRFELDSYRFESEYRLKGALKAFFSYALRTTEFEDLGDGRFVLSEDHILTEEEYLELKTTLDAVPQIFIEYYDKCVIEDRHESYYDFDSFVGLIWDMSYKSAEKNSNDALYEIIENIIERTTTSVEKNIKNVEENLSYWLAMYIPLGVGLVFYLIMWISCIKLLKKTNKYTIQLFGTKKVKVRKFSKNEYKSMLDETQAPYKAQKQQYEEQLKEYKAYRKAYFGYLVELGYFEEGVPHVAKKQKA